MIDGIKDFKLTCNLLQLDVKYLDGNLITFHNLIMFHNLTFFNFPKHLYKFEPFLIIVYCG